MSRFIKRLLPSLIIMLSICSCGVVEQSSGPHVPPPPVDPGGGGDDDPPDIPTGDDFAITVTDLVKYYYVGETFSNVYRLNIIWDNNGTKTDISNRHSGIEFKISDSKGNDIDPLAPFTKSGLYNCQVYIKNNPKICSDVFEIEVKDSPKATSIEKIKLSESLNYSLLENSCLSNLSYPSKGTINTLVVPVEVSDYPFASSEYGLNYLSAINKAFNGNGANDTGYWESVSSYYKKSSKNQLNFNFEIADVYKCGYSSNEFLATGTVAAFYMAEYAISAYKAIHGNNSTQKFDNDEDGYVDGIWLVYSAPDYATHDYGVKSQDVFWAFCSDITSYAANISSPNVHSFGWASISFLTRNVKAPKIDTHTFVHETGHLLSLPDYYSYDCGSNNTSGAQGGLAMMDVNIGDQDAFSKIALGWADPYYVNSDAVITLKPNESTGDCLILADHWNGTAFDEYLLLDLVVPTGLNELDSKESYDGYPKYYSTPGVRMYHIDARLGEFKYLFSGEASVGQSGVYPIRGVNWDDYYLPDSEVSKLACGGAIGRMVTDSNVNYQNRTPGYTVINANSPSRCLISDSHYSNNRLISLIGADNLQPELDDCYASNNSLFKKGDSWTTNGRVSKFFTSTEGVFNNNDNFSYIISILECNENEAKIQIRKA